MIILLFCHCFKSPYEGGNNVKSTWQRETEGSLQRKERIYLEDVRDVIK